MGKEIFTPHERKFLTTFKDLDKYQERNSLGIKLVQNIAEGGFVLSCFLMPGLAHSYKFFNDWKKEDIRRMRRVTRKYVERGIIEIIEDKAYVTTKGRLLLKSVEINNFTLVITKSEKFSIISFDIPENKKYAREVLRKKLQFAGFEVIHQSLYRVKGSCSESIFALVKLLEIESYVLCFETNKILGLIQN